MAIDASIYQNMTPIQVQVPNVADAMGKAMNLSQMAMQNRNMQMQMQNQQALRDAYSKNTGPDGKIDQSGFISDLGKTSPQSALEYSEKFNKMNKDAADSQSAQIEAANKIVGMTLPKMQYLEGLSEDERSKAFPSVMKQMESSGVPTKNVPKDSSGNYIYDPGFFRQSMSILNNSAENLANMQKKAEIQKAYSDIGQAPAKLNAELYGSRSPNATLTDEYTKQVTPIRSSQMAMNQMMDNYKNPSPQGDASLVLNAFKIKFPNAPDVNSLEELTKSQSASDTWKNAAHKALEGGLDQATRDNLMRDGVSTFRANVDSLKGVQERMNSRAKFQNVNDPTITSEPAIDKTYQNAMSLQKDLGPYVPPTERGGIMSGIAKKMSGFISGDSNSKTAGNDSSSVLPTANAGQKTAPPPNAPQDSVLMKSPSGKLKWVSKKDYGEAIASGGSVVK